MEAKPTESELEILSLLWQREKASVREIHEKLAETKDTGYTTTLKTLQNMFSKGLVTRDDTQRTHVYYPALDRAKTQKSLLGTFLESTFGGSAKNLVMQALGQSNPSKEELDEIRRFLDELTEKGHGDN